MICLICTAVVAVLYIKGWLYGHAERLSRDWLLTNSEARQPVPDPRIVLLAIDEDTRTLGLLFADDLEKSTTLRLMKQGFPWNRAVYADIIDRLADAGAQAIILDIVFPAPGRETTPSAPHCFGTGTKWSSPPIWSPRRKRTAMAPRSAKCLRTSCQLPRCSLRPKVLPGSVLPIFVPTRTASSDVSLFGPACWSFLAFPAGDDTQELLSLDARALEKVGLIDRIPKTRHPVMLRFAQEIRPFSLHEIFVDAQWNSPSYEGGKFFRDKIVVIGATQRSSEDRVQTPSVS